MLFPLSCRSFTHVHSQSLTTNKLHVLLSLDFILSSFVIGFSSMFLLFCFSWLYNKRQHREWKLLKGNTYRIDFSDDSVTMPHIDEQNTNHVHTPLTCEQINWSKRIPQFLGYIFKSKTSYRSNIHYNINFYPIRHIQLILVDAIHVRCFLRRSCGFWQYGFFPRNWSGLLLLIRTINEAQLYFVGWTT